MTVGMAALSCPFSGCRSPYYHLPGECLREHQLELEPRVCVCRSWLVAFRHWEHCGFCIKQVPEELAWRDAPGICQELEVWGVNWHTSTALGSQNSWIFESSKP